MPVEEQVVVDLRRHQRLPRRHPRRRRAALRGRAARVRSAPATATCSTRIRDRARCPTACLDGDAFKDASPPVGRRSTPTEADADAEASTTPRRRDAERRSSRWLVARSGSCAGGSRRVESTKKITQRDGAHRRLAASCKAQQRVAAARPYSEQITEVIRNLAAAGAGRDHPLLQPRDEVAHGRPTS